MLLCYGSYINGTANKKSDVDMYFIPRNEKGYELGETFILDGIGYDIFGLSWERVENIAKFNESLSPLVGDVKILYSYSERETDKFKQLQQHMRECLNDRIYMHNCASDRVKEALDYYDNILFESSISNVRMMAGYILMFLSEAVAYMNQTYFHKGLKTQYADLKELEKQPSEFTLLYHDIIIEDSINNIRHKCEIIIQNTIDFLELKDEIIFKRTPNADKKKESNQITDKAIDYNNAACWYEELSSTFNKIYICTENKDYILAFISACCLQNSLESELEMELKTTDLLSEYKYDDLEKLAFRAKEIELNCIEEIEKNHAKIRRVSCLSELKH